MFYWQVQCVEKAEILKLCDKYFEEDVPEYYFDRCVSCIKCKVGSTIPFNFKELERFQ